MSLGLLRRSRKDIFYIQANRETRKAGSLRERAVPCDDRGCGIVRRLSLDGVTLFNMSMNPGPSIEEYVNSIARIAKIKVWIPNVPSSLLFIIAYLIDFIAKPLGIKHPFSPVRIRKLIRSNNILPTYLVENGYDYKYTLDEAFADWKKDCPEEWH